MYTNTKNKRFSQKLYDYLKLPVFFSIAKIGLVMLSIFITSCNRDEDSNVNQDCPEVSLDIKEDINDKTKIIVQATSSITEGITYSWQITDKDGSKEVSGDPNGALSWKPKEGETKFCVTVKTLDCTEDIKKCISYNVTCEDKIQEIASKPRTLFSKPVFKDGYMYYAQQKKNFLNESELAIYKLNTSDEDASPINIIDVKDNVFGRVHGLVFIGDILYVSVSNHILFSKFYKIDTSMKNPKLVEILDLKLKNYITGMVLKGNDMYSVSGIRAEVFKLDLTKSKPVLNTLTVIGKRAPHEARSWTRDMVSKGSELYISAWSRDNGDHIVKIDLNDPNLKQKIVVSNLKGKSRGHKIELQGDDLYILFSDIEGSNNRSWISKINTTDSSPTIEKVKEYNFFINDFSFDEEFMYISIRDKEELVKVSLCSL